MATTPPPAPPEPLSVLAVKMNLRLDIDDETQDDYLSDLIVTAREFVEEATGLVLTPRVVTETARELGRWIELASWPVVKVTQIRVPSDGLMVALSDTAWQTSYARRPVRLLPTSFRWGTPASCAPSAALPVEIDVQAGYATSDAVPAMAKQAMHLLVASWYSNRSAVESGARAAAIEVPLGATALCDKLKLRRI